MPGNLPLTSSGTHNHLASGHDGARDSDSPHASPEAAATGAASASGPVGAGLRSLRRRAAVRFIVLIGLVSLFADMTYEAARSVTGPFLATLGASATIVGIVAGAGELVGYTIRLFSGYASDRSGRYWTLTIAGYVLNLFAVPLLALATTWPIALVLIVAERTGRALRTPTRNAMLTHAASRTGTGWAFGLHEAMDTTGAVIGPLIVSAVLYVGQGYTVSFALLAIPALLSLFVLLVARSQFPQPHELEVVERLEQPRRLSRSFWIYSFAGASIAVGYADFSLLAYHFSRAAVLAAPQIPVLYAVAMMAAAVAALALGCVFDQVGISILVPVTLVSAFSTPLALLGGPATVMLGVVCWGVGMGAQESVMRAAVGTIAPRHRRATAFGFFDAIFGVAWFVGSVLLGILYDRSVMAAAVFSLALQLLAVPVLLATAQTQRTP